MGDVDAALELAKLLLRTRRRSNVARAVALLQTATARRNWQRISVADWEEARDLLRQLKRSTRNAHKYLR